MGTNYYIRSKVPPPCECCKRPYEAAELHIGKSSAGWKFNFRGYDGRDGDDLPHGIICTAKRWREITSQFEIVDEYNKIVPFGAFWEMVESKQDGLSMSEEEPKFFQKDDDGYEFSFREFS